MIARTRTAAIASSAVAAVAVGVALMLPAHSGTPAASHFGHAGTVTAGLSRRGHSGSTATGTTGGMAGGSSGGLGSGSATGASGGSGLVVQVGSGGSGSSSGGSGSGGTFHLPVDLNPNLPHVLIRTVTAIPSPSGTIGDPGVPCLQGYVWRQAYAGDYVCVTPANRTQAAQDNAAALSRVQPGGGAYGQYTCSGTVQVMPQVQLDDLALAWVQAPGTASSAVSSSQAPGATRSLAASPSSTAPPGTSAPPPSSPAASSSGPASSSLSAPPPSSPPPDPGTLSASPSTVRLAQSPLGGPWTGTFTLTASGGPVAFTITVPAADKLLVTPATGKLTAGQGVTVTVTTIGSGPPYFVNTLTVNPGSLTVTVYYPPSG